VSRHLLARAQCLNANTSTTAKDNHHYAHYSVVQSVSLKILVRSYEGCSVLNNAGAMFIPQEADWLRELLHSYKSWVTESTKAKAICKCALNNLRPSHSSTVMSLFASSFQIENTLGLIASIPCPSWKCTAAAWLFGQLQQQKARGRGTVKQIMWTGIWMCSYSYRSFLPPPTPP